MPQRRLPGTGGSVKMDDDHECLSARFGPAIDRREQMKRAQLLLIVLTAVLASACASQQARTASPESAPAPAPAKEEVRKEPRKETKKELKKEPVAAPEGDVVGKPAAGSKFARLK